MSWNIKTPGDYINGPLTVAGSATITGDLTVDTSTLKVDSTNNRVGIGTASPGYILEVVGNAVFSADATCKRFFVNDTTGNGNAYINGANGSQSVINLGGQTNYNIGAIIYDDASNFLAFKTNSVEAARFNSTGNLVLKGGTAAANGVGITFPATPVASSDANCLDDYEEGTWTPVIADATTGGNVGTCTINSATYTKIGRQVSIQCDLRSITTTGMTGGNNLFIRGLPFASVKGGNGSFYTYRVGRNASTVSSAVTVEHGVSHAFLSLFTTSSANTNLSILVSDITSGTSELALSVTYTV